MSVHLPVDVVLVPSSAVRPRCPQCHCFVRLDAGTCTACGLAFGLGIKPAGSRQTALSSGSIHAEPDPPALSGGNPHQFLSNLRPDGKIRRPRQKTADSLQLDLFSPVEKIDASAWVQGVFCV